jgi:hypothetical protein
MRLIATSIIASAGAISLMIGELGDAISRSHSDIGWVGPALLITGGLAFVGEYISSFINRPASN